MLTNDKPIRTKSDDDLGFTPFSKALANAISEQPVHNGLVISINGAWGSGKTSAINLTLEALAAAEAARPESEKTVIVHFDPWLFTGQHNLVAEFFNALDSQVKNDAGASVSRAIRGVKKFVVKGFAPLLSAAASTAGAIGVPGATIAGEALKAFAPEEQDETATLLERLTDLRKALKEQQRRILVVIDDIDRLYPDEMRLVLSMLKSVADLPNVVYLLPMEIATIEHGLINTARGGTQEESPVSYLEKIIQVKLDLPAPSLQGLEKLFSTAIFEIAKDAEYELEEMELIGYYVFNAYMRSPRAVGQLANALRVSWDALKDQAYFPDLLAVEAVRLFEPTMYEFAKRNKAIMLLEQSYDPESTSKRNTSILSKLRKREGTDTASLIRHMFPVFGSRSTIRRTHLHFQGRRLRDDEGYDLYFRWSQDDEIVSAIEIRQFQTAMDNETEVAEWLETLSNRYSYNGSKASDSLLRAIAQQTLTLPTASGYTLTQVLINHDCLSTYRQTKGFSSYTHRTLRLAVTSLVNAIDVMHRLDAFTAALMHRDVSLDAGADLLESIHGWSDTEELLTKADLANLVTAWLRDRVMTDELSKSRNPYHVILHIEQVLGQKEARTVFDAYADDFTFASSFSLGMMSIIHSSAQPNKPYRELREAPPAWLVDLERLLQTLNRGNLDSLAEVDRLDINKFRARVQHFLTEKQKTDQTNLPEVHP